MLKIYILSACEIYTVFAKGNKFWWYRFTKSPLHLLGKRHNFILDNDARVAELVDALDLGSSSQWSGGSNPPFRTNYNRDKIRSLPRGLVCLLKHRLI